MDGIPALEDPDRETWIDDRYDYDEERIVTLGLSRKGVLYVVSAEATEASSESSPSEKRKTTKLKGMVWVEHNPGDPPIESDTDWDAVAALTNEQVHAAALSDPDAQPIPRGTDEELAKIGLHKVVNTRRLRDRLGLTQEAFAARYRIPVGTLRDWEQGRKFPDAPARAYLLVIDRDAQAVARLLGESAA